MGVDRQDKMKQSTGNVLGGGLVWSNNLYFKEQIFLSFLAFFHIFFDQFHLHFYRPQGAYPW